MFSPSGALIDGSPARSRFLPLYQAQTALDAKGCRIGQLVAVAGELQVKGIPRRGRHSLGLASDNTRHLGLED